MKKARLLIILVVLVLALFCYTGLNPTYSRYKKDIDVNVTTTSADMICDATIDNPGTYISNDGWAYFKVIVKNYDTSGNITKVPIQYNLTVSNQIGSTALYRYLDAAGNSNSFINTFTTRNYTFTTGSQQSQVINIEVRTDSMTSEDVDFAVDLNCYQIQK